MPKKKTKSTAKKRFRITKRGKIFHKRAAISHHTSKERSAAKSRRHREKQLTKGEEKKVRRLLGLR